MSEKTVTLPISGMTCANCAGIIERGLRKLEGVRSAAVNFVSEQAQVRYDSDALDLDDLVAGIQ